MFDKLVFKVKAINTKILSTIELVTKTQYESDKKVPENKIEHVKDTQY